MKKMSGNRLILRNSFDDFVETFRIYLKNTENINLELEEENKTLKKELRILKEKFYNVEDDLTEKLEDMSYRLRLEKEKNLDLDKKIGNEDYNKKFIEQFNLQNIWDFDWEKVDFKNIKEILKFYYFQDMLEEFNRFFSYYIREDNLKKISKDNFREILKIFSKYIEKQIKFEIYYPDAISELFNKVLDEKYFELEEFEDFIEKNSYMILDIISKNIKDKEYLQLLFSFGDIIILQDKRNLFEAYNKYLRKVTLRDSYELSSEDFISLLYKSIIFKNDQFIFNIINSNYKHMDKSLYSKEFHLYKIYRKMLYDAKKDFKLLDACMYELDDFYIKEKLLNYMKFNILNEIYPELYIDVYKMNDKIKSCPLDGQNYKNYKKYIIYYKDGKVTGAIKIPILYCDKCRNVYIYEKVLYGFEKKILNLKKIDIDVLSDYYDYQFENKSIENIPEYDFE